MAYPFFTIGHARRPISEFIALLLSVDVKLIADVRTVPRSRSNPQFNRDTLPQALVTSGIGYEHMAALGGLRSRSRAVPPDVNAYWQNDSFHNYADYALSEAFREGLAHLREAGHRQTCAIMCAETLWWRCHRRIIADYLLASGDTVFHILGPGQVEPAVMNEAARPQASGYLTYPPEADRTR